MRITIVLGFFLPVPPLAGGASEKSWHGLAGEFAAQGHDVVVISRRWPGLPHAEVAGRVRHLRLRGYAHTGSLLRNLWRDFLWSCRVWRALPPADIAVVNCIALPLLLAVRRRRAGRLVVMTGRVPKGQYRFYRGIDRVLAVSSPVERAVVAENPQLQPFTRIFGYPIDWQTLAHGPDHRAADVVTIGFIGRLHREKGLTLLASALRLLAARPDLPPWRVRWCGPSDVARGGSGPAFVAELEATLAAAVPRERFEIRPPEFDAGRLVALYRSIDVFCYPSLAVHGETFGVAVVEAMAAGAVPVVSQLPCFTDFVRDGVNGLVFDHTAPDAAQRCADALAVLVADAPRRTALAQQARTDARAYDFPTFARRLLDDFSTLK